MKKTNFLFFTILSIFLIAGVSASVSYGRFSNGAQSATIVDGHSVDFTSFFGSVNLPMLASAKLYSTQGLLYSFENNKIINSNTYTNNYTVDRAKYLGSGSFFVTLSSSDSSHPQIPTSIYTLTLNVNPNTPSVITSAAVTSVNEGQVYSYPVVATDVDADTLIYSLSVNPGWLAINSATGLITGTAPNVAASTNYNVNVQVSDGINTVNQAYVLTVNNNSNPPVMTAIPNQTANEGANYSYQSVATDIDGDVLTYSLTASPSWLSINPLTGLITGTAPSNLSVDTDYNVTVQVSDGINTDSKSYVVTVKNTIVVDTNPPVVTISYPRNGVDYDSDVLTLTYTATDPEGNLKDCWFSTDNGITFSARTSCTGVFNINSAEGSNKWIVYAEDNAGNIGSATVIFTVTTSTSTSTSKSNKVVYAYHDSNEAAYSQQNQPSVSPAIDLTSSTANESFFARLIRAIINFFKALFGIN